MLQERLKWLDYMQHLRRIFCTTLILILFLMILHQEISESLEALLSCLR